VGSLAKAWRFFVDHFCTVDTRTLGIFRIATGLLLLTNLYDRIGGGNLVSLYSNQGVLPNHYALFLPPAQGYWSVLLGFSSPWEMRFVFTFVWVIFICYTLGLKTRWMQVLALVAYESVNNRFILIQHGGNVVVNIMLVWSVFLPLGERFSLDALLDSLRRHKGGEPADLNARAGAPTAPTRVAALAYFGFCFNFAAIYFFNALHKGGSSWLEGSTIHYVLWQNRMATHLAAFVRMHEPFWLSPALTWGTLVMEWSLPWLIILPFFKKWLRAVAVLFVNALHGGIALLCTLGPFSYSMMATSMVLWQTEHFDLIEAQAKKRLQRRTVRYQADVPRQRFWARIASRLDLLGALTFQAGTRLEVVDGGKTHAGADAVSSLARALPLGVLYAWLPATFGGPVLWLMRTLHAWFEGTDERPPRPKTSPIVAWLGTWVSIVAPTAVLIAVLSQLSMENWGLPPALKIKSRPQWMTGIIEYLTIPQGWSMFAPEPPRDDARLVVDATLTDGTHLDLLTGAPPDFEPWKHGPWWMDQHWCEFHSRMKGWGQHWRNFRDFLVRTPIREDWRQDLGIQDFEVYFVANKSPPPGSVDGELLEKKRLFGMRDWPL
jgi:hypothetical protein